MSSPTDFHRPQLPPQREGSNSEDGTFVGDNGTGNAADHESFHDEKKYLSLDTTQGGLTYDNDYRPSPSQTREQEHRLDDDLAMLQVERQISTQISKQDDFGTAAGRTASLARSRSRKTDPIDDFDIATNPIHNIDKVYKPPENPTTRISKFFKRVHESNWLVRYFTYIIPIGVLLLIPILLGTTIYKADERTSVGGVYLRWFGIWLEIVWLSLWAARIIAKCLPWPIGMLSSLVTNNSKKWRDLCKQLELPATLFFWSLAVLISFLPTMVNHLVPSRQAERPEWINIVNKVIIAIFVALVLNFLEKFLIQLISISFHLRTYADRIEVNKFQIASLVKLYVYSKEKIGRDDSDFEDRPSGGASGARTPMQFVENAQRGFASGFRKVGDVAGKVAGDFTGRQVMKSNHPHQVVLALLNSTPGSQILARRLYRTFVREDQEGMAETIDSDDMRNAFDNDDEADAAFTMFDKDLNGDITMEELEAVCVEIGRERKSITASLKDLESVISKLNNVLTFIVCIIAILVLLTIISTSAAGVLTSLGSSVLGLSWLLSATAQEFLQSIIFVFVKHPFDVGDRVTIYGSAGSQLKGDDYFVKEISLLYTEFKKMEGHVVQAPNSYLNTLFILNMRRSGGLAEAVPIIVKFGTTLEQIEGLRMRLFDFVKEEKREYQPNILTEVREVTEAYSLTINVVFFYKSNWQNELLRLQRRNKFICAMMVAMQEVGIEGPRAGQKASFPFYINQNDANGAIQGPGPNLERPLSTVAEEPPIAGGPTPARARGGSVMRSHPSILRRPRGESVASLSKKVDFSLGMKEQSSADITGDVYDDVTSTAKSAEQIRSISAKRVQRERESLERERSESRASATGRDNNTTPFAGLNRTSTDSHRIHRNRFFGGRASQEDPAMLAERGMAHHDQGGSSMEMPQIQRIDNRTGIVSPQAVRMDTSSSALGSDTLRYGGDITNQPFTPFHAHPRRAASVRSSENAREDDGKRPARDEDGERKKD